MSEEYLTDYKEGDIVWVKLGPSWWPGEVIDSENLPSGFLDLKKPPLVIVKFFDEDSYEYVKTWANIYPFNCEKKNEFIKKGMAAYRAKAPHLDKFPKDVTNAEVKVGGNPNILSDPIFLPEKKRNYVAEVFGTPSPKAKSLKDKKRNSSSKNQRSTAHITHRRFIGLDDYKAYICIQYPEKDRIPGDQEDDEVIRINRESEQNYNCHSCGFVTKRLEVMILHTKSHIYGTYMTSPKKNRKSMTSRPKKKEKTKKRMEFADKKTTDSSSSDDEKDEPKPKKRKTKQYSGKQKRSQMITEEEKGKRPIDFRNLLAEWEVSEEELDTTMNESISNQNTEEQSTLLDHSTTSEVKTDDSIIVLDDSKSNSDKNIEEVIESEEDTATRNSRESSNAKMDKETQEAIKSCFDFDEDEEDEQATINSTVVVGRKIPRVIPPTEKRKSEDDLDVVAQKTEDKKKEGKEESEKERKNDNKYRNEEIDNAFKELMAATEVPDLPEVQNTLKCEQNFHSVKTIKFPDKTEKSPKDNQNLPPKSDDKEDLSVKSPEKSEQEVATKLTNPKKWYVKCFEDFENEIRRKEEQRNEDIRRKKELDQIKRTKTESATENKTKDESKSDHNVGEQSKNIVDLSHCDDDDSLLDYSSMKTKIMSSIIEEANINEESKSKIMSKMQKKHKTPRSKIMESYLNDKTMDEATVESDSRSKTDADERLKQEKQEETKVVPPKKNKWQRSHPKKNRHLFETHKCADTNDSGIVPQIIEKSVVEQEEKEQSVPESMSTCPETIANNKSEHSESSNGNKIPDCSTEIQELSETIETSVVEDNSSIVGDIANKESAENEQEICGLELERTEKSSPVVVEEVSMNDAVSEKTQDQSNTRNDDTENIDATPKDPTSEEESFPFTVLSSCEREEFSPIGNASRVLPDDAICLPPKKSKKRKKSRRHGSASKKRRKHSKKQPESTIAGTSDVDTISNSAEDTIEVSSVTDTNIGTSAVVESIIDDSDANDSTNKCSSVESTIETALPDTFPKVQTLQSNTKTEIAVYEKTDSGEDLSEVPDDLPQAPSNDASTEGSTEKLDIENYPCDEAHVTAESVVTEEVSLHEEFHPLENVWHEETIDEVVDEKIPPETASIVQNSPQSNRTVEEVVSEELAQDESITTEIVESAIVESGFDDMYTKINENKESIQIYPEDIQEAAVDAEETTQELSISEVQTQETIIDAIQDSEILEAVENEGISNLEDRTDQVMLSEESISVSDEVDIEQKSEREIDVHSEETISAIEEVDSKRKSEREIDVHSEESVSAIEEVDIKRKSDREIDVHSEESFSAIEKVDIKRKSEPEIDGHSEEIISAIEKVDIKRKSEPEIDGHSEEIISAIEKVDIKRKSEPEIDGHSEEIISASEEVDIKRKSKSEIDVTQEEDNQNNCSVGDTSDSVTVEAIDNESLQVPQAKLDFETSSNILDNQEIDSIHEGNKSFELEPKQYGNENNLLEQEVVEEIAIETEIINNSNTDDMEGEEKSSGLVIEEEVPLTFEAPKMQMEVVVEDMNNAEIGVSGGEMSTVPLEQVEQDILIDGIGMVDLENEKTSTDDIEKVKEAELGIMNESSTTGTDKNNVSVELGTEEDTKLIQHKNLDEVITDTPDNKPASETSNETAEHKLEIKCVSTTEDEFKFSIQTNLSNLASREEISAIALATLAEMKTDLDNSDSNISEDVPPKNDLVYPDKLSEPELVAIEGNLTVVSEKDLADGQVEITTEKVISSREPQTLANFSMDFSDSTNDSTTTPIEVAKHIDFESKGTEFSSRAITKELKPKDDTKKGNTYERYELLDILEGNSDSEKRAELQKKVIDDDMCDFEEHIPSQIVCSSKFKQDIDEIKKKETPHKSSIISTTSKLMERLTDDTRSVNSKAPVSDSTTKASAGSSQISKKYKPILLKPKSIVKSEQIIKPTLEAGEKPKNALNDIEDVEAFVIHKEMKKHSPKEEPEVDTGTLKQSRGSKKRLGKATILQQTIITPEGKIIQPIANSPAKKRILKQIAVKQVVGKPTLITTIPTKPVLNSPTTIAVSLSAISPLTTSAQLPSTSTIKAVIAKQSTPLVKAVAVSGTQDDNIFDINSMPIVLSDEILTPESIENMPIVISGNDASAAKLAPVQTPAKRPIQTKVTSSTPTPTFITTKTHNTTPKMGRPRVLQTVASKPGKTTPLLPNMAKPGKYIIIPQGAIQHGATATKVITKKTIVKKTPGITGVVSKPSLEPSGNKIMIVTNQQGQQQRLLLTPAQQKMLGYQGQGGKLTKTMIKGNVLPKGIPVSKAFSQTEAGTSKIPSLVGQKLIISTSSAQGLVATTSQVAAETSQPGKIIKGVVSKQLLPPKKMLASGKTPKTILITSKQGHTVKKITTTEDDIEKQVAAQLEAIRASSGMKLGIQPSPQPKPIVEQEVCKPVHKTPSKRSYSKKVEQQKLKVTPVVSGAQPTRSEALSSPPPLVATSKKVPTIQPAEPKKLVSKDPKPQPDRPLNQLVIQDAVGNQTTITEGQILALPSETLDGQPQSYMLVTLDESGNLTPLNNEALMSLDPNLSLGGDLSNMVLQIDQGTLASGSEQSAAPLAQQATVKISNPPGEGISTASSKIELPADNIPVSHPVVSTPLLEPPIDHRLQQNVLSIPETAVGMQQLAASSNSEPGQQLIVTGDPIATQKFLESLTEGTTDLANIIANAEGKSILIQADGQQILINTNADNQMLLSMNSDNSDTTEGGGNPIFATQPNKNTDILAAALADTDVFTSQPKVASQLSPSNALYPMNVGNVLETSLTLNSPIMTPLEVTTTNTKKVSDESDILAQVPKNVDLPITITDPNISQTVANQQVATLMPNDLHANLELSLPISESAVSACLTSPGYTYSLPTLDESVDIGHKPFNSSMPLLNDDIEEAPQVDETPREPTEERDADVKQSDNSAGSFLEEESRFTLGGEMCSSLSEPPPEMFDIPEVNSYVEKHSGSIPLSLQSTPDLSDGLSKDDDTTDLSTQAESSNDGSCEIPLQPKIVAKSLEDLD